MEPQPMVPDGLPSLSHGAHHEGRGQACVMELVSVIAGEEWSDHPRCVHPLLREAAIIVNDRIADQHRGLLIPVMCRFFGTNTNQGDVTARLVEHFEAQIRLPAGTPPVHPDSVAQTAFRQHFLLGFYHSSESAAEAMVAWLNAALDVFDAVTGREDRVVSLTEGDVERAQRQVYAHA